MCTVELNTFTRALCDVCRENMFGEKWLVVPSLRVGFQWLDKVTRSGQPVLNVRVKTIRHLALEFAGPEMERRRLEFLSGARAEVIVAGIFGSMREKITGYLWELKPDRHLTRMLYRMISDLRLAGLHAEKLRTSAFEVGNKGKDIGIILGEYEKEMISRKLADYASVLRMARSELERNISVIPAGIIFLIPQDSEEELRGLEKSFWDAIPAGIRKVLPVDQPDLRPGGDLSRPGDAPRARGDNTTGIFRAIGEVNEVREVFRRSMEAGLPFDQVEIIHTDTETYVPLIYEIAARFIPEKGGMLPVTFAEGVPVRYSRPGRALRAWLEWVRGGFPQQLLADMIQSGLLRIQTEKYSPGFVRLGAFFRSVRIGMGAEHYLEALDMSITSLNNRLRKEVVREDEEEGRTAGTGVERLRERLEGLKIIRELIAELVGHIPAQGSAANIVLEHARYFLENMARPVSQFDFYSRRKMIDEIMEFSSCLQERGELKGEDAWEWLDGLTEELYLGGLGPRPGRLFVSNISRGGHSGRKYTFIIGMDDGRFPGAGLQDPLLLDAEREKLSTELATASGWIAKKIRTFHSLLARLRGTVTLSYSCRDLVEDREMFPSAVMLSLYRLLSGNREGDLQAMLGWLGPTVSFAPDDGSSAANETEWWLWRACTGKKINDPERVIGREFPHLGRGFCASRARAGSCFTEYDGYVPEAGKDYDPSLKTGPVLSASMLESLGACPLEFFFKHILGIEPPEEYMIDPNLWLDPAQKGSLLHGVFREFMESLRQDELMPDLSRDEERILAILNSYIEEYRSFYPQPSEYIFDLDCRELRQAARIFLREEEEFCLKSLPLCFEIAVGMPREGGGTFLDSREPVKLALPDGRTIRLRGRIDRLDEISGRKASFTVWDYKTGSSSRFKQEDPFQGGRFLQGPVYLALAEEQLRKVVSPEARVEIFGYFFPNMREKGQRIAWDSSALAGGKEVIGLLCQLLAGGCFPLTDKPDDIRYSQYQEAFGDMEEEARRIKLKLTDQENVCLHAFRLLRGAAQDEESGNE
jgi:ATP-dependent helicase/nuclease subunit B